MEVRFTQAASDADVWDDVDFRDAYLDALVRRLDEEGIPAEVDEEWDAGGPGVEDEDAPPVFVRDVNEAGGLLRQSRALAFATDEQFRLVLAGAAVDTDPWVGPDPFLNDPDYEDPHGLPHSVVLQSRSQKAVRAAALDLAMRAALTENQVRTRAHRAETLAARLPRVWAACRSGDVSEQNATIATSHVLDLPDDPAVWAVFEEQIRFWATACPPGRFKMLARRAREKADPQTRDERHAAAVADRQVRFTTDDDGVGTIFTILPVVTIAQVNAFVDAHARLLRDQPGEHRTLAQLRADVLTDILHRGMNTTPEGETTASGVKATIYVTIPALTLLGQGDEPAQLHGYGPITLDEARKLAGGDSDWVRVLTHPVDGTLIDLERRTYRVPKSLRRRLYYLHHTCVGPGCTRPADQCDIDHQIQWSHGGTTSTRNNAPLCPSQHPVKDESLWDYRIDPDSDQITWTSPTGYTTTIDPDPPF